MKKELVLVVFLLFFVKMSYADVCGGDISFNSYPTEPSCGSFTLRLRDISTLCNPLDECWDGYTSASLALPEGLSTPNPADLDKTIVSNINLYEYPITCSIAQDYEVILTLSNGSTCEESISLNFAPVAPSLALSITAPSSITKDIPTDFTVEVNNDGTVDVDSVELLWEVSPPDYTATPLSGTLSFGKITVGQTKSDTVSVTGTSLTTDTLPTFTVDVTNPTSLSSVTASETFSVTDALSVSCTNPLAFSKDDEMILTIPDVCTSEDGVAWTATGNADMAAAVVGTTVILTTSSGWTGTADINMTASKESQEASDSFTVTVLEPGDIPCGQTGYVESVCDYDQDGSFSKLRTCAPGSVCNDCNDDNRYIHPRMNETCDGIDQNCNLRYDEDFDEDADGFTSCGTRTDGSDKIKGTDKSDPSWDCNNTNEFIFPTNENPYCDCDNTNKSQSKRESISDGECEDNLDNDCDDLTDDEDPDCDPCNIFDDFNPFPEIIITRPERTELFIDDLITFKADVDREEYIDKKNILWEFGDGGMAYRLLANYSYEEAGTYTAKVSIRDKKDCHTSFDTIELTITECKEDTDCGNSSFCCDNLCKAPECIIDLDCEQEDPLITDELCENKGCDAFCSRGNCTISCTDDEDCNDLDDSTIDKCGNPGSCGSRCLHKKEELQINIVSPKEGERYPDNFVMLEYSTNMDVECEYQLNYGNKQKLYTNKFEIWARPGDNVLELFCNGKKAAVKFAVEGEANLIGDIAGESDEESSLFDFLKKKEPLIKVSEEEITTLLGRVIKDEGVGYELKRELSLKGNQSTIKLGLKNIKTFLALKNVELTVTIPKSIAENVDQIRSEPAFTVVEADPVVRHAIPNIGTGGLESVSYSIDKEITEELLNQIAAEVNIAEVTDEDIEEVKDKIEETQDATEITKRIVKEAGKTTVTTTIVPKGVLKDTKVFLEIPKCMAEKLNEVAFKNKNFKVISDDPLIVWHFTELSDKLDLSYEVSKDISVEDCERQSVILALAEQIEAMEVGSPAASYWRLILAALVVPVVGFGVVYFHKTGGKSPDDKKLDDVIDKTVASIKDAMAKGYYKEESSLNNLKLELYKNGWDAKSIEKLFKRIK